MTKILLTRHGHVEGIKPERFRGREPLDLTARGRAQAAALAERIAGAWRPAQIYTSPLDRCIETGNRHRQGLRHRRRNLRRSQRHRLRRLAIQDFRRGEDARSHAVRRLVRYSAPRPLSQRRIAAGRRGAHRRRGAHGADAAREETIVLVGHDSVNRALLLRISRSAAVGLLAHRAGPVLPQRDRSRRRKCLHTRHQRNPASRRHCKRARPAMMPLCRSA